MSKDAMPLAFNVAEFWAPWLKFMPGGFHQPILPGWTLNINSNNSSAPETEVNVVAKHSYGRQIGRISDALRELLLERHATASGTGPAAEFLSMWDEIDKVKTESATARLEQIASDLALLKAKNPRAYLNLREAMTGALKNTE